MMPISEIHVGDQYENPLFRPHGVTFIVLEVNKRERMVKVQAIDKHGRMIDKPFWKRNTDRMFDESWRVFCGKDNVPSL
jgi:hypothetical protein